MDSDNAKRAISRRRFISLAGATAAAAGLPAVVSATGDQQTVTPTGAATAVPTKAPTAAAATAKAGAWDADVIVVGAAGSGLVAACFAADGGAKVLQFDKTDKQGGCWLVAGGSSTGPLSKIQIENGIYDDSPALYYSDCMRIGKLHSDPEVLKFFSENCGYAIDWLDSLGAYKERKLLPDIYTPAFTKMRHAAAENGGKGMLAAVQKAHQIRQDRGDIKLVMKTQVTDLIRENGRVVGVKAKGADGVEKEYRAGAVILATGGYTYNQELVKKYNKMTATSTALPHATGDGIVMCEKLGAAFTDMDYLPPYLGSIPDEKTPVVQAASVTMGGVGPIWVDLNGKRLVAEDAGAQSAAAKTALQTAKDNTLVVVFDKAILDASKPLVAAWGTWDDFEKKAAEGKFAFKADTIADLAKKMGIDGATLAKTIETYNGYVTAGKDAEFDRKDLKFKIATGPFYAIKTTPNLLLSKGGPKINAKFQVIDTKDKVIRGLYAVGEFAGGSKVSGWGNLTGVANTLNVVSGKQAGLVAAEEALALKA